MYRPGLIPKRDGKGWRQIQAPDAVLKAVQRHLLKTTIAPLVDTPIGFGILADQVRNCVEAARVHARRRPRCFAKADIEAFFDNTHVGRVAQALHDAGVDTELVGILAAVCTRAGRLPQGAPTSPAIASLVLHDVDRRVSDAAKAHRCVVCRYGDDFGVSGNDRDAVERVVKIIAEQVERIGYHLNASKTRIMGRPGEMVYLGLDVSRGRPVVSKGYRERVAYLVRKACREGIYGDDRDSLEGQVEYITRLHPGEGRELFKRLKGAPLKQ